MIAAVFQGSLTCMYVALIPSVRHYRTLNKGGNLPYYVYRPILQVLHTIFLKIIKH
jgi:hypothetical protein